MDGIHKKSIAKVCKKCYSENVKVFLGVLNYFGVYYEVVFRDYLHTLSGRIQNVFFYVKFKFF